MVTGQSPAGSSWAEEGARQVALSVWESWSVWGGCGAEPAGDSGHKDQEMVHPLTLEVILKLQSACTPLKMSLKCRVGLGWDPGFCTSHRSLAMPRRLVRPLSGKEEGRKLAPVLARIRLGPKCLWRRGTEPRFLFPK